MDSWQRFPISIYDNTENNLTMISETTTTERAFP